jgi:hypothetical protein
VLCCALVPRSEPGRDSAYLGVAAADRPASLTARSAGASAVRQEISDLARSLLAAAEDDGSGAAETDLAAVRDALRAAAGGLAAAVRASNQIPMSP